MLIFITIAFHKGGMSLKGVRLIQRIVGVLLLAGGIYLIFVTQEFFGTLLIILAFLTFPIVGKKNNSDYHEHDHYHERYHELANDQDSSYGGEGSDDDSESASGGD